MLPTLRTRVITPEGVLFDGQTIAVSGRNDTGPFSILPGHANFISITYETLILHTGRRAAQEITIQRGVLFCRENQVDVYVGISALAPGTGPAGQLVSAMQPPAV